MEYKGCVEFISEVIFGKYSKMKILVLKFLKKANFEAISRPSTLKTESFFNKYSRVGYVCSAQRNRLIPFSIWVIGQENRPWPKGLKVFFLHREQCKI